MNSGLQRTGEGSSVFKSRVPVVTIPKLAAKDAGHTKREMPFRRGSQSTHDILDDHTLPYSFY